MKIIIVGCGKVGLTLAHNLTNEKHDIILVDKSQLVLDNAMLSIDCMSVIGNGAIQSVLIEAQVETADYLIACTSSDEINILTCLMARKSSKCRTIARIRNPEYAKQLEYIMSELDITMTINPELATAREILRIIKYPKSITSSSFFKGRLNSLLIEIPENSKIVGVKLSDANKYLKCNVLICVIERNGEIIIPNGNSIIEKNDKILFVADNKNVLSFFSEIGYAYKQLSSFMIIGAGRITHYLVNLLLKNIPNCSIKVVEKDLSSCEDLASKFPNISVVHADATEKNVLIKEGMNDVGAFITLTGLDEENIILALLANNTKTKSIAKVNHLNFADAVKDMPIGSIVNPERIAANIILSYVRAAADSRDSDIDTLYRLFDERIEAMGFRIKTESIVTNIKIKDLKLKKNVVIAGIYRNGNVIMPNGFDELIVGDSVVIITKDNKFKNITEIVEQH